MREPRGRRSPQSVEDRILDAAERLLVDVGYAAITTRKLAEEAGANQGLIHYYFGSMEELFLRVLERFTDRLVARQRAMYSGAEPYSAKWWKAIGYLDADRPYQKVWCELQAMSWNRPEYRKRVARVHAAWCDAMREAVAAAVTGYDLEQIGFSLDAWITLIVTVNEGIMLERLSGIDRGHAELLDAIQRWLDGLEESAAKASEPGVGGGGSGHESV